MKTHKDLRIWKEGILLSKEIYQYTANLPDSERFGITKQLKRCAVSVPINIAEGAARQYDKEYIQFLHISLGSLSELETLLILCRELNIGGGTTDIHNSITKLRRQLLSFIKFIRNR